MAQAVLNREAVTNVFAAREGYVKAFRGMLLARLLDEKFATLYRAGKIHGGVFLGRGQEALSVAAGQTLRQGDIFAPLIRDAAGRLAFGETVLDAARTYLGSALGPMRGRDGNVHRGNPKAGYLPMISHLGAMISVVNGTLLAHRFKKISGLSRQSEATADAVGITCIGEGATSTGAFHEALNQAGVEKLPLILIVANNQYAYSTPTARQFACRSLVDRAAGYGLTGHTVEGNDLTACLKVVGDAVSHARAGGGPQFILANLLRLCGHGEHDDAHYIDPGLKSSPLGRDCLKVAEEHLLAQNWVDAADLESWRVETLKTIEEVISQVQREPAPDPYAEDWSALSSESLLEGHE